MILFSPQGFCLTSRQISALYFKDVVGQDAVKRQLIKSVQDGHVSHALMFAGLEGSGNLPLSIAFAGYVFCENPGPADRCGQCSACKQMDALSHPDFHLSYPIVKTKSIETSKPLRREFMKVIKKNPYISLSEWEKEIAGDNKKSLITAKESEEIIKSLSLKSFAGGHKVLIIWHAAKMNAQASNKLLKTLEEPTGKTIIILVVIAVEDMLPTIISRTQLVRCSKLSDKEIADWLEENHGVDITVATHAAKIADGNYGKALSILREVESPSPYLEHFSNWMRACVKSNMYAALLVCDKLSALSRDEQQLFLEYSLQFLHQSILFEYRGKKHARFDTDAQEFADRFAPYMAKSNLEAFHDVFSHGHYLVQRNVNTHLLFLKMSYDMMKIFNGLIPQHIS